MAIVIESQSDSSQARRDLEALRNSVGNIETTATKVTNSFNRMVTAMQGVAAVSASFVTYARMSDQLTNMTNRLRVTVDGQAALNEAMANTRKIALATGSDLKSVTNLYAKIHEAGKRFNLTQAQSARFTESVSKTIQISGATATEATGALLQFGQALSSNRLGGEELRSVLEQAPALASVIEKGIGKGAGTLRKLAEQGVLTFDVIYNAISKQTESIDGSFKRLDMTYGRAFTNLGTSFDILIANLLEAFGGGGGGLAEKINDIALDLSLWALDVKRIILVVKSAIFNTFLEIEKFLDKFDFSFPLKDFFSSFEGIHQFIIKFLTAVDAGFEWLYDRVIGHSWVPDLVNGVIEWFQKLLGAPVKLVEAFASAIDVEFSVATKIVAGFGAALLAGFLIFGGSLGKALSTLLMIPAVLSVIAGFSFLKTGIVLDFDTSINSHLKILQNLAEKVGLTLKELAAVVATTLAGSFLLMNKRLLPTLTILSKFLLLLGSIAAFGVLAIGKKSESSEDPLLKKTAFGSDVGPLQPYEPSSQRDFIASNPGDPRMSFNPNFTGDPGILLDHRKKVFEPKLPSFGDFLDVLGKVLVNLFKALFKKVTDSLPNIVSPLRKFFGIAKETLLRAIEENPLSRTIKGIAKKPERFGEPPTSPGLKLTPDLGVMDAIKSLIPEDLGLHLAGAVTIAISAGLYAAITAGPLGGAIALLFAGAATAFTASIVGPSTLLDYFGKLGVSFLSTVSDGLTGLFGGNVIKDPFGLLAGVAALSLVFEKGRQVLKDVVMKVATAPITAVDTLNDYVNKAILQSRIGKLSSKLQGYDSGKVQNDLNNRIATSQASLAASMNALVGSRASSGATLSASAIAEAIDKRNVKIFASNQVNERLQLNNAILQTAHLQETATQLKEMPAVVAGLRENKKVLNTELIALRQALAEQSRRILAGITNAAATGGGILGSVAGFQKGTQVADAMVDATPLQKMFTIVGFTAIGQLIGASFGAILVQTLALLVRGAVAVALAHPFIVGAGVIATALYAGYQLFTKLPDDWGNAIRGIFSRQPLVQGAQNARSEVEQRFADIDRLKASLKDSEITNEQRKIIENRILDQEKAILSVKKAHSAYLEKNDASFLEKQFGGFRPQTSLRIDRLQKEHDRQSPYKLFPGDLEKASKGFQGSKRSSNDFSFFSQAIAEEITRSPDFKRNLRVPTHGTVDLPQKSGAYQLPTPEELRGITSKAGSAADGLGNSLKQAGSFFTDSFKHLSGVAEELGKTFKDSGKGLFSLVKQQASVEEGLRVLQKSLADINIAASDKALKALSTKDIQHISEGFDKVKDFSEKAKKMQKGSFSEKAALDLVEEWKKNIKNTLGSVGDSSFGALTGAEGADVDKKKGKGPQEVRLALIDQLNIINEAFPKLEYTLEEFRNSTDEVREAIFNQAKDIYESSRKLDATDVGTAGLAANAKDANARKKKGIIEDAKQVQIYTARQAIEAGRQKAFENIQSEIVKVRTGFKQLANNLDGLGLSLREDVYNQLTDTQLGMINEIYSGAKDSVDALKTNQKKGNLTTGLRNSAQEVVTSKAKDLDQLLQTIGKTTYEKTRDSLSRFNVFIQEQITNVATDVEREALGKYTNALVETAKLLDSDDEKLRLAAANTIDNISGRIEEFIFRKANTVSDASRTIGLNYLNNLNSGVQGAFTAAMKGDDSLGGGILGTFAQNIANVVTTSIIESFTKGLTDTFLGNQGMFSSSARRFGEMFYTSFGAVVLQDQRYSDVFSNSANRLVKPDFGKDVTFPTVDTAAAIDKSVGALTDVTKEGLAQEAGFFARLGATFISGLTSLATGLGSIFNGLMSMFGGKPGGTGSILMNGLFSVLGAVGGLGGAGGSGGMSAGNLKAASAFKFFAAGGLIYGPGTETSDSIPVMASRGEYVVNAKSVKKFKPLLDSINNGRITKLAKGGLVHTASVSPEAMASVGMISANQDNRNTQQFNMNVTGDISRQTRREILEMIPTIASSVNRHNRERGIRS